MKIDVLTDKQIIDLWFLKEECSLNKSLSNLFNEFVMRYLWVNAGLRLNLYERLQKNVQDNKQPVPEDRRGFLVFILLRQYISQTHQTWIIPKDTKGIETYKMVEEYPSLTYVFEHRKKWGQVVRQFHQNSHPMVTDSCLNPSERSNSYTIITSFEDLYKGLTLPSLSHSPYILQEVLDYNDL